MAKVVFADEIKLEISDEEIFEHATALHDEKCAKGCERHATDAWLFWAELDLRDQERLDRKLSDKLRDEEKK